VVRCRLSPSTLTLQHLLTACSDIDLVGTYDIMDSGMSNITASVTWCKFVARPCMMHASQWGLGFMTSSEWSSFSSLAIAYCLSPPHGMTRYIICAEYWLSRLLPVLVRHRTHTADYNQCSANTQQNSQNHRNQSINQSGIFNVA